MADRESPAPRVRLEWLDLYRGIAVLVMIETHVANTFLATTGWPAEWRVRLNYVNGLVAPAFLFIAGFAYGCGLRRRATVRADAGRRLRRLAGIAALGYAMHIPWPSLLAGRWSEALMLGSRMDILHCLAIALAVLVLIDRFCHRYAALATAGVMAAAIFAAPLASIWTGPLAAAVNQSTGSLFPLLPWSAFVFAGFAVSELTPAWSSFVPFASVAAAAVFLIGRVDLSPVSSAFFFERLAWILLLVPVCGSLAAKSAPRWVLFAGRESLSLYLAHLLLIAELERFGWGKLGALPTLGLFVAILGVSFAIAAAWRHFSVARADRARRESHRRESSAPAA